MKSDTEIIVVPLRQMLLFEKLFAQNYADMLVRFGSIIETCNKINGYWESDGWTEIYEDMADKSDRMNEIVDDMTNYVSRQRFSNIHINCFHSIIAFCNIKG